MTSVISAAVEVEQRRIRKGCEPADAWTYTVLEYDLDKRGWYVRYDGEELLWLIQSGEVETDRLVTE